MKKFKWGVVWLVGLAACAAADPKLVIRFDRDGEPVKSEQLVKGREAGWSPDGKQIVFVRDGIYTLNPADVKSVEKINPGGCNPRCSPDGRYIAYADDGIWITDVSGGSRRKISDSGHDPCWLSDSRRIAYSGEGIWILDIESGQKTQSAPQGIRPVFSPRHNWMLYELFNPKSQEFDLWLSDLDKNTSKSIVANATDPAWSPDGKYILYNSTGVWVAESDGRQAQRLTVYGQNPGWSPKGDKIIFDYKDYIWIMNAPFKPSILGE